MDEVTPSFSGSTDFTSPPEPPAGIIFSNVLPTDIFINMNNGGYEIIDTPHAQDTYTRHRKQRTQHRKNYYLFHSAIDQRRLRILANSGYKDELQNFLEGCPNIEKVINSSDNKKRTALHFAASRGSDEIVHALLQYGADPNLRDFNGNTPLHLAACTHHIRVITLLLRFGADVKATDSFGKTPLHLSLSRLKMFHSKDTTRTSRESAYSAAKKKAEMGEIVAMLKEYFEKSGQKNEHTKICELTKNLLHMQTVDEVNEMGSLLSNFTQMTIDAAAKSKMSEE